MEVLKVKTQNLLSFPPTVSEQKGFVFTLLHLVIVNAAF